MKIFIRTFGCTLNQSDSEVMAGLLVEVGHELVDSFDEAELVLFNTCTVKDAPEKKFYFEMNKALSVGKKVLVAGCISQADSDDERLKNVSIVGVNNISRVAEVIQEILDGNVVHLLDGNSERLNLIKIRRNDVVEIIPICAGCLGNCSYCKTKMARGNLKSYPIRDIKKQFEEAISFGVKEVWLTSQDNGAYGKDIETDFITLLKELLTLKGDYRIRIGMMNPNHALEFVDELIEVLNHPNVFKFIHLPIQSGSDKVLKDMNRKYSSRKFVGLVDRLRKGVPNITIATDIITGFPTETEKDFQETHDLLKELKIPVVNLTKFFARKGTIAKNLKPLANSVGKNRTSAIAKLQRNIINNNEWIDWEGEVIIDEFGKNTGDLIGRNDYYKQVVIKNSNLKLGDVVNVKIVRVTQYYLVGVIK